MATPKKHPGIFPMPRTGGGTSYLVKYRDASGRQRSKTFRSVRDAKQFQAEQTVARGKGRLTSTTTRLTLAEFWDVWKEQYADVELAPSTVSSYQALWNAHVRDALGHHKMAQLAFRPALIQEFRAAMAKKGVGDTSARKALTMLQGIFQRAIEWNQVEANPVQPIKKPSQKRKRHVEPIAPEKVEAMRRYLLDRDRLMDATYVSVLAYAGLRPGEALALRWRAIKPKMIRVEHALTDGVEKSTKTRSIRSVELFEPLQADLDAWRDVSPYTEADDFIFVRPDGAPWRDHDYRNWRRRGFDEACRHAEVVDANPYDLRHSFCSLLIHEGRSPVEVAAQLGHAPTMTLDTYAHVFQEFDPGERLTAAERIAAARS